MIIPWYLTLLLAAVQTTYAAVVDFDVSNRQGVKINNAVVYANPNQATARVVPKTLTLNQKDRMFIPAVLPVQKGSKVLFQNEDNFNHSIYSVSDIKNFELPLFSKKDKPPSPLTFNTVGAVPLGCNIHDNMIAFIYVVDTPYFAKSVGGSAAIDLPQGTYKLYVWHPRLKREKYLEDLTISGGNKSYRKSIVLDIEDFEAPKPKIKIKIKENNDSY